MSLTSLSADLQSELLSYLPNFSVLNSLLLTSRSFHTVFLARRDFVLKHVAQNFLGLTLGEELIGNPHDANPETGDSTATETIKLLVRTRDVVETTLEPIVFRLLQEEDVHWDEPDRCPSFAESTRLRRAAYRFVTFCALPSQLQQGRFLAQLETIEIYELVHLVDGMKKMVTIMLDVACIPDIEDSDDGRVPRLVSTGPANICRLWNMRALPEFRDEMMTAIGGAGTDSDDGDGAFDDAFHHFEVSRNLAAFDPIQTRALLDVGHQETQEALLQLECLMIPPP
ncbi:hypothetical protein C8R47DRAFT_1214578 [Mycena vitilis]|nr:hypothetical protein C8R47DRAFT_1214578 [Mycena vitilis]